MIYGIESPDYNAKDMFVGSDNPIVHCYTATPNGLLAGTFSLDKSYAITMQFARGTAKEYVLTYYVRAFAQLSDGQYVYSDIESYTDYNIADYVYQKCLVTNRQGFDFIYNSILKVVNPDYKQKSYVENSWTLVQFFLLKHLFHGKLCYTEYSSLREKYEYYVLKGRFHG